MTLDDDGVHVYAPAGCSGFLARLSAVTHEPRAERGRVRLVARREPLFTPAEHGDGGCLRAGAGLAGVAAETLRRYGFDVRLRVRRPRRLPSPEGGLVHQAPWLADALAGGARALVRYRPACFDVCRLVADIARAWPGLRMVVAVATRGEVTAWAGRLRSLGLPCSASSGRHMQPLDNCGTPPRVAAATFRHGAADLTFLHLADLVVLPDAAQAARRVGREFLDRLALFCFETPPRVLGLLPLDERVSSGDAAVLAAYFGPGELALTRPGRVRRRVAFALHTFSGARPVGGDILELKRRGVWRNPARNRRLVRLARAVAAGDGGTLARDFRGVPHGPEGRRVALLAENDEHREQLRLHGASCSGATTFAEMATVDDDLEVIVRADAGTGLPPVPASVAETSERGTPPLLVVDTIDRHHPEFRARTLRRLSAYAAAGWYQAGAGLGGLAPYGLFGSVAGRGR